MAPCPLDAVQPGNSTRPPLLLRIVTVTDSADFEQPSPMSVIQDLYDSEINFSLEVFWDAGFEIRLGDTKNGFPAHTRVRTWADVEAWLIEAVRVLYPDTAFAVKYRAAPVNLVFRLQVLAQPDSRKLDQH